MVVFQTIKTFLNFAYLNIVGFFKPLSFCFLSIRFCVCMLHEQFVRYLNALDKLYLAHHDSNCACEGTFCKACEEIDRFNISWLMRRMLCTPLLRFPGSTIRLYSWDCIENRSVLLRLHSCFLCNRKCSITIGSFFSKGASYVMKKKLVQYLSARPLIC